MSVMIIQGDATEKLKEFEAGVVHTCVTSPPYWGLRDYGTAKWEGGDAACDHQGPPKASDKSTLKNDGRPVEHVGQNDYERGAPTPYRDTCGKCGAKRIDAQLGLENTPEEYTDKIVRVFQEIRRVLRDDGTVWLNLGDSYCTQPAGNKRPSGFSQTRPSRRKHGIGPETVDLPQKDFAGLKPKDLVGIPWLVAFALRADGWYLRSEIIWNKPNPMPESMKDRPTVCHEHIFLLTKSSRYYYDGDEIMEPCESNKSDVKKMRERKNRLGGRTLTDSAELHKANKSTNIGKKRGVGGKRNEGSRQQAWKDRHAGDDPDRLYRNKRSVWTIPTAPYTGAHFATFPPDLIKPCILAGCPQGGTVLDPFAGSGTTGEVAEILGRNSILIELNPEYIEDLIEKRTAQQGLFCNTGKELPNG